WLPGLDVLSAIGIHAAVVPHWDNTDGTNHDTRYCFLGERRFGQLEGQLPDDVFVLGIDEHTAVLIDLDARLATVRGRGGVTIRRKGEEVVHASGHALHLDELTAALPDAVSAGQPAEKARAADDQLAREVVALRTEATALERRASLVEPLVGELVRMRAEARA